VPFLHEYASRWWSALFSQAMFAPVYIFFFGVSLTIVRSFNDIWVPDPNKTFASAALAMQNTPGQGWLTAEIPIFISFFLAIACMWLALQFARSMADSVGELKGLYDLASKGATQTFWSPTRIAQLPVSLARMAVVDPLGARTREGSTGRWLTRSMSGLLRGYERFASGKKGEKGMFAEAEDEYNDYLKGSIENKNKKRLERGGWLVSALLAKDKLTPEEEEEVKDYLASQKIEDLVAKHGWKKVAEWADKKLIDGKKLAEVRGSNAFTQSQKKAITDSYFKSFMEAGKVVMKNGKIESADWDKVAELWENMDETEQQILLAERSELKTNREFLSRLKKGDFDAAVKGMSKEDQGKAKTARSEGLTGALRGAKNEDDVARVVKKMSEDEIGGLDEDTALHILRTGGLSASEKQALYNKTRSKKVKTELKKNHRDDIRGGTGMGREDTDEQNEEETAPESPQPEPQNPPQAAPNQGPGLGGGNQADLTPGAEPTIIREEPSGPLR